MADGRPPWIRTAIAGRPMPGEEVSGDRALVAGDGDALLLAAIDGLGHGSEAARAAAIAETCIAETADLDLRSVLAACDVALTGTRGAAISVVRVDSAGHLQWLGVGNVDATLVRVDPSELHHFEALLPVGGVVGQRLPRLHLAEIALNPGDVLLLNSDGVQRRFLEHIRPTDDVGRIAGEIIDEFSLENDDAVVLVARFVGPQS